MITVIINGTEYKVPAGISIYNACYLVGILLPRFCYFEALAIAGNCRTCYVEVKNMPKLIVACAITVAEKMSIITDSDFVKEGRANSIELILKNHPLDCPICDQAGECDLQEQSIIYGTDRSNFFGKKRVNHQIILNSNVKTQMNRCITCGRCVRFINTIVETGDLNIFGRGEDTIIAEIKGMTNHPLIHNVAELCPVGALTNATKTYNNRAWQREYYSLLPINQQENPLKLVIDQSMDISITADATQRNNIKTNMPFISN